MMKKLLLLPCLLLSFAFAEGSVTVSGTSTFHDWNMTTTQMIAQEVERDGDKLTKLIVVFDAETLKSKEKKMDTIAHKALKTDKFSTIKFELLEHNVTDGTLKGIFTIAGKSQELTTKPSELTNEEIKGEIKVKMTDFDVAPPTFMFGAMKTGDEITVSYSVKLTK